MHDPALTTGLPSLDQVLKGLLPGDNVVWQVDAVEEYQIWGHAYAVPLGTARTGVFGSRARAASSGGWGDIHEPGSAQFEAASRHPSVRRGAARGPSILRQLSRLARMVFDRCGQLLHAHLPLPLHMIRSPIALYRTYHSPSPGAHPRNHSALLTPTAHRQSTAAVKVQHRYSPTMNLLHSARDEFKTVPPRRQLGDHDLSASGPVWPRQQCGVRETSFIHAVSCQLGEYRPDCPPRRTLHTLYA